MFSKFTQSLTLVQYCSTSEINLATTDEEKFIIVEDFISKANYENCTSILIDGVRIESDTGWGLLRASNTSPNLVLRFEAETEQELEKIKEIFYLNLKKIEPDTDRF